MDTDTLSSKIYIKDIYKNKEEYNKLQYTEKNFQLDKEVKDILILNEITPCNKYITALDKDMINKINIDIFNDKYFIDIKHIYDSKSTIEKYKQQQDWSTDLLEAHVKSNPALSDGLDDLLVQQRIQSSNVVKNNSTNNVDNTATIVADMNTNSGSNTNTVDTNNDTNNTIVNINNSDSNKNNAVDIQNDNNIIVDINRTVDKNKNNNNKKNTIDTDKDIKLIVPQTHVQNIPIENVLYTMIRPKNYFDPIQSVSLYIPEQIDTLIQIYNNTIINTTTNDNELLIEGYLYNDIIQRCQELEIYPDTQVYERLQYNNNTTLYINNKSNHDIQKPLVIYKFKLPLNFIGNTIYEVDPYIYILYKHIYTYIGQINEGNTCYQNVALQTLLHIPQLLCILLHPTTRISPLLRINDYKVQFVFQQIRFFIECSTINLTSLMLPSTIHKLLCYIYPTFGDNGQHDAQEALHCIFDIQLEVLNVGIAADTTAIDAITATTTTNNNKYTVHNPLRNLLDGKIRSDIICDSCKSISTRIEPFYSLGQEIPYDNKKSYKYKKNDKKDTIFTTLTTFIKEFITTPLTLQDCLNSYFSIEYFYDKNLYNCTRCLRKVIAKQITKITKLPNILILYLKRFKVSFFGNSVKATREVIFPLQDLDISQYIHIDTIKNDESTIYDQQTVIQHSGTVSNGHYTVTCLKPVTKEWYHYNDDIVTILQPSQVQKQEAYVLIYTRRKDIKTINTIYKLYRQVQIQPNEQKLLEMIEYLLQRTKYNIILVSKLQNKYNNQYYNTIQDILQWINISSNIIQLDDIEKYTYVQQSRSWLHSQRIQPCVIPIDNTDQQCIHGKYHIQPLCGNIYSIPISYNGYKIQIDKIGGGPQIPQCPPQNCIAGVKTIELQISSGEIIDEEHIQIFIQDIIDGKYIQRNKKLHQQVLDSLQEIIIDDKVSYLSRQIQRYICFSCNKNRYVSEFDTYKKILRYNSNKLSNFNSTVYKVSTIWIKKQLNWWDRKLQNMVLPISFYKDIEQLGDIFNISEGDSSNVCIKYPGEIGINITSATDTTDISDTNLDNITPIQMKAIFYLFGGGLLYKNCN